MQEIHGTALHYPWGTTDAIPAILGIPADGRPYAEYWLGAHPSAPATADGVRLDELIASDPSLLGEAAGAFDFRMPFLIKLLSARHALSLQAHPPTEKAIEGYAREDAVGLALDDPLRCYKDQSGKPEILVALSEFALLMGFRNPQRTWDLFTELGVGDVVDPVIGPLVFRRGSAATEEVFLDVLSLVDDRAEILNRVLVAAVAHADAPGELGEFARLVIELDSHFPADPGIMAACLMNQVRLAPGQAVVIPPGTMHAHLFGTGVEVQASSDNVLRGGLTQKHIAVDELVRLVDFDELTPVIHDGVEDAPGVHRYDTGFAEFAVWRLESQPQRVASVPADGRLRIALVTRGRAKLSDGVRDLELEHGQAVLIPANNPTVSVTGDAQVFVGAPGVR
ncbi:MAG TPA: mannose-6-phosphate isomerase, class I [Propioniciclava tarda]|nr:mannose-6-phosphate isomerase, class I [Propioniciclava tarda]HQA30324.1 mannose-6-phosphate isomerase, class I [Propioniciclava tarda]HQD60665.1 mannose-6-phosphate isomerase, class I [Propioniciclava tarda]